MCWDRTHAGETISQNCPDFVAGFDHYRLAYKTYIKNNKQKKNYNNKKNSFSCLEDGTWFAHPESGKEWSNYTTCVDVEDLEV